MRGKAGVRQVVHQFAATIAAREHIHALTGRACRPLIYDLRASGRAAPSETTGAMGQRKLAGAHVRTSLSGTHGGQVADRFSDRVDLFRSLLTQLPNTTQQPVTARRARMATGGKAGIRTAQVQEALQRHPTAVRLFPATPFDDFASVGSFAQPLWLKVQSSNVSAS